MASQIRMDNAQHGGEAALLPFRIYVKAGYNVHYLSFSHLKEEVLEHQITFHELTDVAIGIETNSHASVQIYWGHVQSISDSKTDSFWYTLNADVAEITLFEHGKGRAYPWRCGVYPIEIVYNGTTYYSCYRISPKNLNSAQMDIIHEQLNEQLQGLIIDYLHQKQLAQQTGLFQHSSFWHLIKWFQRNAKDLFSALQMICANPHIEISKQYREESFPKRLDYRSARFENTLKGSVKRGQRYYNCGLVKDIDNEQNRLIKMRVLQLADELNDGIYELKQALKQHEEKLHGQQVELAHYKQRYETLVGDERTPDKHLLTRRKALYTKEYEFNHQKNKFSKYEDVLQEMESNNRQLHAILNQPFWRQIRRQMPHRIRYGKQSGYQLFAKLWKESRRSLEDFNQDGKAFVPVYHPSYLLYEYYVFFGTVRAAANNGFVSQEGESGRFIESLTGTGLPDDFTIQLVKDQLRLDIVYNQTLELKAQEALTNGSHFYLNSDHRKPDIRVDLYKRAEDKWRFAKTMIIEVKYSPLRNIIHLQTYGDTKATKQMDAYGNIKYIHNQTEYNHQPVYSVICAFPGDEYSAVFQAFEYGHLLQFYPSRAGEIIGLRELEQHIRSMIDEHI